MNDQHRDLVSGTVSDARLALKEEIPNHALAMDPVGEGILNRIDRIVFNLTDRLNPILITEARESLQSRQFLVTFFVMLAATLVWTVLGIVFNAPEVYYVPTGRNMLVGYYLIVAVPVFGLVPLTAYRSLSNEIDNDTFALLSISQLSSRQIIRGKFASAVLQMMLYFSAVVPSLAFTYLLRGIGLAEISMVMIAVWMAGLFMSAFALMIAPMAPGSVSQPFAMGGLVVVIVLCQLVVAWICSAAIADKSISATQTAWVFTALASIMTASFVVQFTKAAAVQVVPVTENRSTSIRYCLLRQQAMWIVVVTSSSHYYGLKLINFGSLVLAGYWLLVGTVFLTESCELSPRVRRDLPSTLTTRAFLTALSPGPSSGYSFAICTGVVAILSLGLFGRLVGSGSAPGDPILFSLTMIGYLTGYLGIVRLVTLPYARRSKLSLPLALIALLFVLAGSAFAPSVIYAVLNGDLTTDYSDLEIIDWAATTLRGFHRSGISAHLAIIAAIAGGVITLVNTFAMRDLYAYRKVAVPTRVTEDRRSAEEIR